MLWTEWLMSSVRRLAKALIGSPMLGPEHPLSKVTSINDLALLLYTTAALEATGQTLLGPEHLSTTVIYVNNDLPVLLMYMAAALAALEASEQALGLNDMALPLQDRRRQLQKVAEPLRGGVAHWRRRRRRRRWRLPTTTTWWWWQ